MLDPGSYLLLLTGTTCLPTRSTNCSRSWAPLFLLRSAFNPGRHVEAMTSDGLALLSIKRSHFIFEKGTGKLVDKKVGVKPADEYVREPVASSVSADQYIHLAAPRMPCLSSNLTTSELGATIPFSLSVRADDRFRSIASVGKGSCGCQMHTKVDSEL